MTARIHKIIPTDVSRPFSPGLDCSPLYHSGVKKWVARTLRALPVFAGRSGILRTQPRCASFRASRACR